MEVEDTTAPAMNASRTPAPRLLDVAPATSACGWMNELSAKATLVGPARLWKSDFRVRVDERAPKRKIRMGNMWHVNESSKNCVSEQKEAGERWNIYIARAVRTGNLSGECW